MSKSLWRKNQTSTKRSQWGRFSLVRSAFPVTMLALLIGAFFYLPIPSHVRCNFVVEAEKPTVLYVPSDGRLTFIEQQHPPVVKGQKVALIESVEIDEQLREVSDKLSRAQHRLEMLQYRASEDPLVAPQIVVTKKNVESSKQELRLLETKHAKLSVASPVAGILVPSRIRKAVFEDGLAKKWQGRLTDKANLNCFVERGEELFQIESAENKTVTLFVGERDIDFVKTGQEMKLLYSQRPGELFDGIVGEIYEVDVDLNEAAVGDIGMETYLDAAGKTKSSQTPYRVTVNSATVPPLVYSGSSGRARISVPSQTLFLKMKELFKRLAKFEL